MTQYGGYFEPENSRIVELDNKSKFKIAIRKLKQANVINPATNKLSLENFVRFISDMTNHRRGGEISNTREDIFSLENLIHTLYTYYNPLININNIGYENYILLDEENQYIYSPVLERNPINKREPLRENGNIVNILKFRLTENFKVEKIQVPSKDIAGRIAARKRGQRYDNTGQGQMETDYDESHHLYQDYEEDIKMKSTFVNVLSTEYGNIGDTRFDVIQDYNNINLTDIIKLKLLESNLLINNKFISKIRETHSQKVLVELFNLLYNPLNLPTKNYNPIKSMIETNTIDKFFRLIHSSNGLSTTPEGIARDIRINRIPTEQTITQLFDALDINTFQNEINTIINRFVETIDADVANRDRNYGMCNLMDYIDRLQAPLNQNIVSILRMIINLFGPELIKVGKFDAFNEFNTRFTKIRKVTIFETVKNTITKYIYINRKDKEANNTISSDIDAYYTKMNNGDMLASIFNAMHNIVTRQELNIQPLKPFIGVLNSIRTEPHVINVTHIKKLFNFIVGISKIKEMEIYYTNDIRIIDRIIQKLAILFSLFIDIVNDVQDRTILEAKLVNLEIPQDIITNILDTTNTTVTGEGNAKAKQTEKNNKIVARLARVINEFFERLVIEDIPNRNVDNYIQHYKGVLRDMLQRENMLFESIDRQLLALIENNGSIDVLVNRFETNQQCYQPLENNTNITLCNDFVTRNILDGIIADITAHRADFNINPDMDLLVNLNRTCKIFSQLPENQRIKFGDEYNFDINQPITQPVSGITNNLAIGEADINSIIDQPIYHNMLFFLKQLVVVLYYIYKSDKLLDIADNFGTGIGSMLAYINFNLIMKNPTLYVNKRKVIGKILGIPSVENYRIRQLTLLPEDLENIRIINEVIAPDNFYSQYSDAPVIPARITTLVNQVGYNTRAEFNNKIRLITNIMHNMINGQRVVYTPIEFKYSFDIFADCMETGIRNFLNLMVLKENILNHELLPATVLPAVKQYYIRFPTREQQNDQIAHDEWFKIASLQLRELIRRRLPNLELVMWQNGNDPRVNQININGVNYNLSDMNGGGIFLTIAILILYYGENEDLFNEIDRVNLNVNNADSKRWVIEKLETIINTQFQKLDLNEQDSQFEITMNNRMHGSSDTLFIRIFNFRHYTHTGHSGIDILEERAAIPTINLYMLNTILNIAYPSIHQMLLMRHLHINKKLENYNDILLKSILPERISNPGVGNILQTILDPRFGGTYGFFTEIFNRDRQPPEFNVETYGNYNKIQIMTKLLYSYNKEVKYYFENVILHYCNLSNDPSIFTNDIIEQIIELDNYFSQYGFINVFMQLLNITLNTLATTTYDRVSNSQEDLGGLVEHIDRRINISNPILFLKTLILFRKCITNMIVNKQLFQSLIFEELDILEEIKSPLSKNLNKLIFIKVFVHYCIGDNKIDNFTKFIDTLILTNINAGKIECMINNFWIFYYNNTQNNDDAKLNKNIFDKFIDRLSKYNSSNSININMVKLLFSIQTDILYNNLKLSLTRDINIQTPIFDYSNIKEIVHSRIVFTDRKGVYFQGKNMVYEIGKTILDNIVDNKDEYLKVTINTEGFHNNPITEIINLKLALLQKEYIENILRRLINRKFVFYDNKDTIIEHITNFFEKNPENRFIIDLHSMVQFDELRRESNLNLITLLVTNMTNPFIINLIMKYPKENYDTQIAALQANPRNPPNNCLNSEEIIRYLNRRIIPQNRFFNEYMLMIINTSRLQEKTTRPYTQVLQEFITGNNRNPIGRYVQTILDYYGAAGRQNGGSYYNKYMKYKEKYLRLLRDMNSV